MELLLWLIVGGLIGAVVGLVVRVSKLEKRVDILYRLIPPAASLGLAGGKVVPKVPRV